MPSPTTTHSRTERTDASGLTNGVLIRRMLGLTWRYRWGCMRVMLAQILLVLLGLAGLNLIGVGIDFIAWQIDPANNRLPTLPLGYQLHTSDTPLEIDAAFTVLLYLAGGVLALAMVRFVLNYLRELWQGQLVQDVVVALRSGVYDKLQRLSFRFFDANESGSIINRVTSDVMSVRLFMDGVIMPTIITLLSLAFYIIYMVDVHVMLTIVCLASTPVLLICSYKYAKMVKLEQREARELVDRMILTLSESLQGVHVVKGFALEDEEIAKFDRASVAVRDKRLGIIFKQSVFSALIGFLTYLNIIILLGYGGYLYVQGQIELGTGLVVFATLLQQFAAQVATISTITDSAQQSLIGAGRVFEILDAPIEIVSPPNAVRLPKARGGVRFENISFRYKSQSDLVLDDINLNVEPGQVVAILGATGAGKSTLLSLVPRFYDPTKGRLLIDNMDARSLDLDDLRRNVGLVFQESFLFSNTVAANIAFGHPDATREQIEQASRIAAAHQFIMEMEHGYDTMLVERGQNLSGGQRQRLAIARALLLEPSILILDDATAAVDPGTEQEILTAMDNAMKGRTTFVVAHRLSTLRRADVVIVMDKGRIVERGTHAQLMASGGHYRHAAALQAADKQSRKLLGMPQQDEKAGLP